MFSAESDHAERARTLRWRGAKIAALGGALWQLWSGDWLPFPAWMGLVVFAVAVGVRWFGQHIFHRGKQFEALEQADQVFRPAPNPEPVADRAETAARPSIGVQSELDPVLYLRPFGVDAQEGTGFFGSLLDSSGESLSLEEQLSRAVDSIGPMIAIGQPGELLPTPGAARRYVSADEWQETVRSWMARARLVILRPDCTPGVGWEIETALSMVRPDKLLLLIVRMRRKRYEATRAFLLERKIALPTFDAVASMWRASAFFAFDDQHRVHVIPLSAPFWRGPDFALWRKRFHYALRPFYERHDLVWVELPPRIGLIVSLLALAGFLVAMPFCGGEPPVEYSRPPWIPPRS